MRVVYCRSCTPWSWLIRFLTFGRWSHVAQVHGEDVVEAVWPAVRMNTLAGVIATSSRYHVDELPCADEEAAWQAALSQVGKPYALRLLLGFLVHQVDMERGHWDCVGLLVWCVARGGTHLFRRGLLGRLTPQSLWMLP